ncbi:MAG: hypothetical protein OJF62_000755 [Pseudolabrys sp.]|nr:hypothetical protein [Pseudolabrys sp.]
MFPVQNRCALQTRDRDKHPSWNGPGSVAQHSMLRRARDKIG